MERYIKTEDAIPYLTRYIPSVEAAERSKIDKAIDKIIEKSFISDIYNDQTDDEIIKLDDVLEILKRNIEE